MPATPQSAAEVFLRRAERREGLLRARTARLEARLPAIAELLRSRFNARRVVLFGSLAWGGAHGESDIDLAVEGIESGALAAAMNQASALAGAVVELFALTELPEGFRRRVVEEGRTLS